MSISPSDALVAPNDLESNAIAAARVAIVGLGGLGCPAAIALLQAGIGRLLLIDDDVVDETNLHRQILYEEADVGTAKLPAAMRALQRLGARPEQLVAYPTRCLPDTARSVLADADVIVEGADNYATKFLVCDAAHLLGKPVVHGAAVAWRATVLTSSAGGRPCYRCIFEDLPTGPGAARNCDTAGVMGPVTGFAGALMAEQALRIVVGLPGAGTLHDYDGKDDQLRVLALSAREDCPLCGDQPTILDLQEARYLGPSCAA
jgi:adenylyltransferase/sulfurtransferase